MIKFLILDEIDRIIELGQFQDLKKILDFLFIENVKKIEKIEKTEEMIDFQGQ